METKHTPGPWSRNIKANGKYPVVFAGRNQHVALVQQQKDGAETEANIDLVAAAPALLKAAETYLRLECDPDHAEGSFALDDAREELRDAIAQARGE